MYITMNWLATRVKEVEEAAKQDEAYGLNVDTDCDTFLKAFEKQLHNQLHLQNLCYPSSIFLPIKKGCYQKVEDIMKANQVEVIYPSRPLCECAFLFLYNNKLTLCPTIPEFCKLSQPS